MTYEEIRIAALGRAMRFSSTVPTTRSAAYRRIAQRDAHVVTSLAMRNADFFGDEQVVPVVASRVDLTTLPNKLLRVANVEVETSTEYAPGTPVSLVPASDPASGFPPRASVRENALVGYKDDLLAVQSVRVWYVKGAPTVGVPTPDSVPGTPAAFHELLVVDLARIMAVQMMDEGIPVSSVQVQEFDKEERGMLTDLANYVEGYAQRSSRFVDTATTNTVPAERGD